MALAAASPRWSDGDQLTGPQCLHWYIPEMALQKKVFWLVLQPLWLKKHDFFAIVTGGCIGFIKRRGVAGKPNCFLVFFCNWGLVKHSFCFRTAEKKGLGNQVWSQWYRIFQSEQAKVLFCGYTLIRGNTAQIWFVSIQWPFKLKKQILLFLRNCDQP